MDYDKQGITRHRQYVARLERRWVREISVDPIYRSQHWRSDDLWELPAGMYPVDRTRSTHTVWPPQWFQSDHRYSTAGHVSQRVRAIDLSLRALPARRR